VRARPLTPAREVALRVLFETESRSAFADRLLDRALAEAGLSEGDRRLATQIVQGTLRYQRRLDYVLDQLLKTPLAELPPWIRLCLRIGAYQLLFLDRVPRHAAVDETVGLARKYGHPGTAGLTNAVLRKLPEALREITFPDPEQDLVRALGVYESHPDWIVRRWLKRYGRERTAELLRANNRAAVVSIRVNRRRTNPQALIRLLRSQGIEAQPGALSPYCLRLPTGAPVFTIPAFKEGLFTVQDEAESLVVPLLKPQPGERVLDLCTAPGGKLGHILEWSRGEAHAVGVDTEPPRLAKVRDTLARLGARADLVLADGRHFGRPGSFDRVLVDAPCTGLGVLRRRADARWRKREEGFAELVPLQAALLDRAALLTAPHGVLVYSVCSFEPEECGGQVAAFLARHPEWAVEPAGPGFAPAAVSAAGYLEVLHDQWDTDAVFAARLRRRAAIEDSAEASTEAGDAPAEDDALPGEPEPPRKPEPRAREVE
jgi:16S rRNA (cytosine967-C5)-methyltransferase